MKKIQKRLDKSTKICGGSVPVQEQSRPWNQRIESADFKEEKIMSSPEKIKNSLCRCISEFVSNPQNCLRDPKRDFKRHRKLPLEKMIYSILHFGNETLSNELLDISQFSVDMPTVSAFVQQRKKLLPTAFESIFHTFTKRTRQTQLYKGMRLYAVDGSDLQISTNPKDLESFYPSVNGAKPYNLLHLNALYDLLSKTYVDASIQKGRRVNEHQAFVDIIDRLEDFFPILILADRGYESYNNLAHLQEKRFLLSDPSQGRNQQKRYCPGLLASGRIL